MLINNDATLKANHTNMYKHKILHERPATTLLAFPGADKATAGTQGSVFSLIFKNDGD